MKKLFFTSILILSLIPVGALAQTQPSTAYCQQLYGSSFTYNGSNCVNSTGTIESPSAAPSATTPAQGPTQSGATVDTAPQGPTQSGATLDTVPAAAAPAQGPTQSGATVDSAPQGPTQSGATLDTVPPAATPAATTPAATTPAVNNTCPNGGQLINGVCNLGYTPLEPIPGVTSGTNLTTSAGFATLVNAIFTILITSGALLAVLMLTIGGVQYMTSSSIGNKTQGLDRAKAAIYGILLIAATWLILNTINPQLLNFNFIACAGGGCSSSINSFTQTSGFTTPTTAAPTTVTAPPPPAGATLASPDALQFNNQDSNTTATQQAESSYTRQCQSGGGVPIFTAGSNAGQTAMECIVMAGSQG